MGYTSGQMGPHIKNYKNISTAVSINNRFKHLMITILADTCSVM
jgi:hypothetical protein